MVTNGVSCGDWLLTTHMPAGQELAGVTRARLEKTFREIASLVPGQQHFTG